MQAVRNDEIEQLRSSLAEHSLKIAPEGQPFTLASGRQSKIYFDVKHVTLAPEPFLTIGKLFWDKAMAFGASAVGGLAAGAIPIAMAVVAHEAIQGGTGIRAFYVKDERKQHGTKESLFQAFDRNHGGGIVSSGSKLVIVDDVLTSGKSIALATQEVLERGGNITAIVVLVDRREGGASVLRERFNVPVVAIFTMDGAGTLTYHGGEVS